MADLMSDTEAYCDVWRGNEPILVIQTGPTEIQLSMPVGVSAAESLRTLGVLADAIGV